jgi:hypothetical protein
VRRLLAFLNDLLIVAGIAIVLAILLSGGGRISVAGVRISARSVDNPLALLSALLIMRFMIRGWAPVLGVRRWPTSRAWAACRDLTHSFDRWAHGSSRQTALRIVWVLAAASLCLKIWYAARYAGFYSGDDVEIHEMSLRALLHRNWPVWDLRSPIFPLGLVYPAQWCAHVLRVKDVAGLVFVGRLSVAVLSTLSVFALWNIGRRLWPEARGYAVLAVALFAWSKLTIAFGSSELPRPVSTVLVLLAYIFLRYESAGRLALAAGLLALAASFRFSEIVFAVPAALELTSRGSYAKTSAFCGMTVAFLALLLAIPDFYYWGAPFHSAQAATTFTFVNRLSSRGYQPWFWYLSAVNQWTTVTVFCLACIGGARRRRLLLWAAVPLLLLSVLPHKEARYAIPVLPFVALLAATGVQHLIAWSRDSGRSPLWLSPALVGALVLGASHDAGHYRLPRSNDEVALARRLAPDPPPRVILAEQAWRLGGHLYLPDAPIDDLDPASLQDPRYLGERLTPDAWVFVDGRNGRDAVPRRVLQEHHYAPVTTDGSGYVLWRAAATPDSPALRKSGR